MRRQFNAKRRNIGLYNQYTSSSIGAVNNNDLLTSRSRHVYFDSREDVRLRGKENTIERGMFQCELQTSLKNVKRITIHQITLPGTLHNVQNRSIRLTIDNQSKDLVLNDETFNKENINDFALKLSQEFATFATSINPSYLSPTITIVFNSIKEIFSITAGFPNAAPPGYSWEINFNPNSDTTLNFGPFLGVGRTQFFGASPFDYSKVLKGDSIPDMNGFNYMYIRSPELNINSEFNMTEIDINKKSNILARVPVNYSADTMTFDSSWFYPHEVDINLLKNITFQFFFYNGSRPNFHNENISLMIVFDYYDN